MEKREIRKDIPEKFYKDAPGNGYPVVAYTVGELKTVIKDLPDDIEIRFAFDPGVHICVFNVGYDNTHLSFSENELSDFNDEEDEE